MQRDELAQKEVRAPARSRCAASYEYCVRSDSPSILRRLLLILRPLRLSLATATTPTNTATAPTLPRYYDGSFQRELEYLEATIDQAEKVRHNLEEQAPQKPEIKKKKK